MKWMNYRLQVKEDETFKSKDVTMDELYDVV